MSYKHTHDISWTWFYTEAKGTLNQTGNTLISFHFRWFNTKFVYIPMYMTFITVYTVHSGNQMESWKFFGASTIKKEKKKNVVNMFVKYVTLNTPWTVRVLDEFINICCYSPTITSVCQWFLCYLPSILKHNIALKNVEQ